MGKLDGGEFVGERRFDIGECIVRGDVGGDVIPVVGHSAGSRLDAGDVSGGKVLLECVPCC